jgi:hypothetical protein
MRELPNNLLLKGDMLPQLVDNVDLRNDNAGGSLDQLKNIILRYLENVTSDVFVDSNLMVEDITRHWPFQGTPEAEFWEALSALREDGLIVTRKNRVQINKVARVSQRWLSKQTLRKNR